MNQTMTHTTTNHTTEPAKGFAITALVCGIVGVVSGLIPLLAVVALAAGLVAIVFGLLGAKRNKQAGTGVGMARAGWILGVAAVILAVIGFVIVDKAFDNLERDLNELNEG